MIHIMSVISEKIWNHFSMGIMLQKIVFFQMRRESFLAFIVYVKKYEKKTMVIASFALGKPRAVDSMPSYFQAQFREYKYLCRWCIYANSLCKTP